MPCHPARARKLLKKGRASVHKVFPFTIRLTDRELENSSVQPMLIKIDPGSKETGIALVREEKTKSIMLCTLSIFSIEVSRFAMHSTRGVV